MLSFAAAAQATDLGINTDPAGSAWNRGDAGTAYAQWDTFTGVNFTPPSPPSTNPGDSTGNMTFSNLAPGSSFNITSPTLSQVTPATTFVQGAGLYNTVSPGTNTYGNDIFLNGGNAVDFKIATSLNFTAYGVTLQIKRAGSTGGLTDAAGFTPVLTINSANFTADGFVTTSGTGDTTSNATGSWSVTTWYWGAALAGLTNTGSSTISIDIPKNTSTRSIDTFAVDFGSVAAVTPVPEPGTYAIALALLAFIGFRLSRTRRA